MQRSRLKPLAVRFALGAVFGLTVFGVEGALLLKTGAVGVKIDTSGPFAALMAIVRPMLPPLLLKVAALYAVAGGVAGAVSVAGSSRAGRVLAFALGWLGLWSLFAWERAVLRPALFDDVPKIAPLLESIVGGGEPWHPRAAACVVALALAAWMLVKRRAPAMPLAFALGMFALWPRSEWLPAPSSRQAATSKSAKGPIVLIGVDALRVDRLKALGGSGAVTPHLDAFLTDATLFTNAFTPIAQTEPAWRSLLTARWPHRTGVRYPLTPQGKALPLPTLPAALDRAGYFTHFATDCSRFHFEDGLSGFALREQPPRGAINFLLEKLRFRAVGMFADNALGAAVFPEFIDNRALAGTHDPLGYAERLGERWNELAARGPALLAFHATAAHFPGDPTYPFYRRFVAEDEPLPRRLRMQFAPITATPSSRAWNRAGSEALYDELLAQADAQVGLLLAALKREGQYENATIVVFSDHGESFHADRPELAGATPVHGARLGAEENQILLAVKLPSGTAREVPRVDSLVRLVDIAPTLLELAGAEPLPASDGQSFAGVWRGEAISPRYLYAETGMTHALPEVFDPGHRAGTPRDFSLYRIRSDGVVEVDPEKHETILAEKDVGAFDGKSWVIDSPRADGTVTRRCSGACDNPALEVWLSQQRSPPRLSAR